ncbi:MAG: DUF7681 family protein [Pseudomonadota bacterium]
MTQHQGLPVAGYQPQSDAKVSAVNTNKQHEELLLRRLDELKSMPGIDGRWLQIGRTHIEEAFMAINRAIFQPQRIALPTDNN